MSDSTTTAIKRRKRKGRFTPLLCNVLGSLMLVLVIGVCIPLAIPRLLGYEVFDVISSSMEPTIPEGSVIYVSGAEPTDIDEGDVIAFYNRDNEIVAHRVVINRTSVGEFVTKGDANNAEDRDPVPYESVFGMVDAHVPLIGHFMTLISSTVGRIYLVITAACGIMLNMLADRMRSARKAELIALAAASASPEALAAVMGQAPDAAEKPRRGWVRAVLMGVLALVFLGSAAVVFYANYQHSSSDRVYEQAARDYVSDVEVKDENEVKPPISIDFKRLQAVNPDVVGWLYCEDTVINYPVLHGKTNDQYLRRDYTGEYSMDGSLFVDCDNAKGFTDASTIIYGHNMGPYGTMFAKLDAWAEQDYYDKHPVMWLLTPEQNYQVVLIAGHHVSARSDFYDKICHDHDEVFLKLLAQAQEESDFKPLAEAVPGANYVMLSTCAYIFDNARYALHGMLVPVG